jgi:DNA-binding transcriptional ArsR family regulator
LPLLLLVHHQIAVGAGPAVTLPLRLLADLGIDRRAKSRGLHVLEEAGLVRVTRERGRPARVALVRGPAA